VPAPDSFTACHIGDLHFWSIPLNPALYFGKRMLGVGNLVARRARKFRQELAPVLAKRIAECESDFTFFSGDFSTTALRSEFEHARRIFAPLVSETNTISVPGNHDCYTRGEVAAVTFESVLGSTFGSVGGDHYRVLGHGVAVFAFNAGADNGFDSFGAIKPSTLESFAALDLSGVRTLIILCHFPPEVPAPLVKHQRGPQLQNADGFLAALAALPCRKLWLHGHDHHRWLYASPTVPGLHYLNAGAPLMRRGAAPDLGFHRLRIDEAIRVETHRHNAGAWSVQESALPNRGEFLDLQ